MFRISSNRILPLLLWQQGSTPPRRSLQSATILNPQSKKLLEGYRGSFAHVVDLIMPKRSTKYGCYVDWFRKCLEYNVPNGGKVRSLVMLNTFYMLHPEPENITEAEWRKYHALAWCIELFHSAGLVVDDIIDESLTRRGRDSWHQKVGTVGIYDGVLLTHSYHVVLLHHFGDSPHYNDLRELFIDVLIDTVIGEYLDAQYKYRKSEPHTLNDFNMKSYHNMVDLKCGAYSGFLPIAAMMYATGNYNKYDQEQIKAIMYAVMTNLQVHNDYMDWYGSLGDPKKMGMDIPTGKCTWPTVKAIELCNDRQLRVMKEHYGENNMESMRRIYDLYLELELPKYYAEYVNNNHAHIMDLVHDPNSVLPVELLHEVLKITGLLQLKEETKDQQYSY